MKNKMLSKVAYAALLATASTSVMAVESVAEATGDALTRGGDAVMSAITGKKIKSVSVSHPVSLYDYSEGTSAYEDAYFNGRFNARDGNQDEASYDLDLSADYEKVTTSADTNTKYEADINGTVNKSSTKDSSTEDFYTANASITHDNYFNPAQSKLFWYGKGELNVQQEADGSDYAGLDDPRVTLSGGVGYGRVVNVTPLAKSMRLIEALVQNGTLSSVPSKAVYTRVADIVSKEAEYRSKFGGADYEQRWIADVEAALGTNLGAAGAIKAHDVLTSERISTRKYGWDVRGGVGAVVTDYDGENGKPLVEAGANYYYPISNRTQFSNEATFKTILDDDNDSYNVNNDMSLTYEVSDRVDWINRWNLDYQDNEGANDIVTNNLSSTYRYYISNVVSFDATVSANLVEDDIDDNGNDKVDTALLMGVNYRLK